MNDSGTPEGTGTTVADAADRIASLLGPADSEVDETQEDQPSDADDTDDDALDQGDESEDEGEQSDEQDETEETPGQPQLHTVKVNGEEVQVTLEEALKGYSREQDYVRKTMDLAEKSKATAKVRDDYLDRLKAVEQVIEASQPRVDQSLRDTNPAEWSAQMLQHRQWAEQRQAVAAEAERLDAERQAEQAKEQEALVADERSKLFSKVPEWSDAKVFQAESAKLIETGESYGFTPEEIGEVIDHRAMLILRDAMLYREIKAKSAGVKAKVDAVKTAKPGAASAPPSKVQDLQRAKTRLRQSGRVDDAAAAIERLMG